MTPEVKERIAQIRRGEVPEGYKITNIGTIPSTWRQVRIKDICEINPHKGKDIAGDVTFLGMTDVSETGSILHQNIMDIKEVKNGLTPFQRGDILIAKITPCFENGKGALTTSLNTKYGFGSTEFHVLRSEIDSTFLFYHTTSHRFRRGLESEMTGSAGQKRVQTDSLASFSLGVPSSKEQQRIAETLTTQDKVIELKEKLIAEKQRQKKYLMQQLLTGKKRLPGFNGRWDKISLSKISEKQNTKNKDFKYQEVFSNSAQAGIIPQEDQFDKDIANADRIDGYYIVKPGMFVYNPRISNSAPCGPISMNKLGRTGVMSPLYTVFKIQNTLINVAFLDHYFQSTCWHKHMKSVANYGARHDRMAVSNEDFFAMPIPFPTLEEQTAIADILSTADREIELLQQELEQEKQKKKALMQLLLTGIVRAS